ncbi:tetratricopeptide repeat-containing sensor histidine kinase [Pinibacter soli]|uniref:tetratricopeptide repeat-containing sensor histidine kinase n=1 Tax=Pinibacter soli TaxID=3044211 RepID=UPI00249B6092|nr:ATP-binding protein [Pinibacter soli]
MFAQNKSNAQFAADTVAIQKLWNESHDIRNSQPERSLALLNEALQKSKEINYGNGIVNTLINIGAWFSGANIDTVIEQGNLALTLYARYNLSNPKLKADIHILLAEAYDEKGKKDSSAYFYYLLNDEITSGNINSPEFEIDIYIKLTAFWLNMDYDFAHMEYTAHQYVEKAKLAVRRVQDTTNVIANLYFLQGLYYYAAKQYEMSRNYFKQYLVTQDKVISIPRKISTLLNISEAYLIENKPAEALEYLNRVTDMDKNPKYHESYAFYLIIANLIKAKALFQQNKYAQTITLVNENLKRAEETGSPIRNEIIDAHKIVSESYKALGEYEKAYQHADLYLALHDSIMKKDKLDMVNQLEIRYRLSEKDKELAKQKLAIEETRNKVHKRNLLLGCISIAAIFLTVMFFLWRKNSLHKQKLQEEKINSFDQQMEITRLNATINGEERERIRIAQELHDGIGGLLAISTINFEQVKSDLYLENENNFSEGLKLLKEASVELRKTAHNIMPEILLQKGLVEAAKSFCERMAGNNSINISFQTVGSIKKFNKEFELLLYRITQELLHNILKHSKATEALVQFCFQEEGLDLTVEDNGIGMPAERRSSSGGMGLQSIQDRIKAINGHMEIKSTPDQGTGIYIEFLRKDAFIEVIS